jgi:hypothetical protein
MGATLRLGKWLLGRFVPMRDDDKIPLNNLGSGTSSVYRYLRGDGVWSPSSMIISNVVFVSSLSDLPNPILGAITLLDNITYWFTEEVDLIGNRIVCGVNCYTW